ncbi:MAG: hypothetical protein ACKVP0_24765 [Pirellulaceae bacterium]
MDKLKAFLTTYRSELAAGLIAAVCGIYLTRGLISWKEYWFTIVIVAVLAASLLFMLRKLWWVEAAPQAPAPLPPVPPPAGQPLPAPAGVQISALQGKILAVGWFIVLAVVLAFLLTNQLRATIPTGSVTASWTPEGEVLLLAAPSRFNYDSVNHELQYSGILDDAGKKILLDLYPAFQSGEATEDELSYREAINKLAMDSQVSAKTQVKWVPQSEHSRLRPGPSTFFYDKNKHQLVHQGKISDEMKMQLLALFDGSTDDTAKARHQRDQLSYQQAIGRLGLQSAARLDVAIVALMVIGGLGGALGAVIRVISNFVVVACYKQDLKQEIWWPTYVLNPLLGFLLGALVVVLVKSGWMSVEGEVPRVEIWWLGLAVLAGFGISDVMDRLRLISKATFGSEKAKEDGENAGGAIANLAKAAAAAAVAAAADPAAAAAAAGAVAANAAGAGGANAGAAEGAAPLAVAGAPANPDAVPAGAALVAAEAAEAQAAAAQAAAAEAAVAEGAAAHAVESNAAAAQAAAAEVAAAEAAAAAKAVAENLPPEKPQNPAG